ncbi:VanZ family protein [Novosphingobium sp.]|uniref:VanZ family protein n=1 Tax=Novosphingobium sp. TaxID=1874826 RepID=UPI0025E34CF7|nr:VanZ family protein [Novosphingobium sp.]MCC6925062.1 VanZ family protein [Novosphingobium sp.]
MPSFILRLLSPRLLRPLFWLLATFALTMALLPKPPQLPIDRFGDKFQHMLAFAVLALVARLAWRTSKIWAIALRLSLFGAAIEVAQAIPMLHRDSDWRDWLADSIAVALALLIAQFLLRFLPSDETT